MLVGRSRAPDPSGSVAGGARGMSLATDIYAEIQLDDGTWRPACDPDGFLEQYPTRDLWSWLKRGDLREEYGPPPACSSGLPEGVSPEVAASVTGGADWLWLRALKDAEWESEARSFLDQWLERHVFARLGALAEPQQAIRLVLSTE